MGPHGTAAEGIQFGSYVGGPLERKATQWMEEEEEGAPVSVCRSVIPSMFVWGVLGQGYHMSAKLKGIH